MLYLQVRQTFSGAANVIQSTTSFSVCFCDESATCLANGLVQTFEKGLTGNIFDKEENTNDQKQLSGIFHRSFFPKMKQKKMSNVFFGYQNYFDSVKKE